MKVVIKPVVMEAYRWFTNGDHPEDYAKDIQGFEGGKLRTFTGAECKAKGWEGQVVRYFRTPDSEGKVCGDCHLAMHVHGWIDRGGLGPKVCPGDWVVKGPDGLYQSMKPAEFEMMFDPVKE